MSKKFKKIALIVKAQTKEIKATCNKLIDFFKNQDIIFESQVSATSDLILVVGGDGSLLHAAKNAVQYDIPILGINQGRLGFLTDLLTNEIETRLKEVLEGQYNVEERFLLTIQSKGTPSPSLQNLALNDIVLSSGKSPHMLEFEIYSNKEFVCSERADGLIISTPTGSTAYSLSAGGPIVHPSMDAIVILPMFSHTLTNRPILVPGNSEICVKLALDQKTGAHLSCDGSDVGNIKQGEEIYIQKYSKPMRMLHPLDYSYYENLRSKLYWGQKLSESGSC